MDTIILGYPLDQLLDRKCKHEHVKNYKFECLDKLQDNFIPDKEFQKGSLRLPEIPPNPQIQNDFLCGTGNIVIKGKPGTAKSTLALQIAVSSVSQSKNAETKYFAIYYSLEENRENLIYKSIEFGWEEKCKKVQWIGNTGDDESTHVNADDLKLLLEETKYPVLFPLLTPRHITDTGQNLFWERYKELEVILASAMNLNANYPKIRLSMVVIDSLNVFGQSFLNRNELHLLFELFKKYHTLGIFIVEETEEFVKYNIEHGTSIIDFLSDVVINLTSNYEDKYYLRFFEITKSRYQHQIYGIHPFKIFSKSEFNEDQKGLINAIRIFPTLHYMVSATSSIEEGNNDDSKCFFNPTALKNYLSPKEKSPSIIMIEGPRGSFKSTLALDFLLNGFVKFNDQKIKTGKNFDYHTIIFRFKDEITFDPANNDIKLNDEFVRSYINIDSTKSFWNGFEPELFYSNTSNKRIIKSWEHKRNGSSFYYTEVAIISGHILPEEFIHLFQEICNGLCTDKNTLPKPNRIVIDEVDQIGVSYPLLYSSYTAGELFLSCLFHIVRNLKISMVVTGTTGQFEKSNRMVERARTLANTVLNTDFCDVFGDRYITITGEGMNVQSLTSSNINEMVPGVIQLKSETPNTFSVDADRLMGLVGFNTKTIYRPGLVLQLVQDNIIQKKYNKNILTLIKTAFHPAKEFGKPGVELVPITSSKTAPIHDSYDLLKDKPIEKTVVCTVDEFFDNDNIKEYLMPLYTTYNLDNFNEDINKDRKLEILKYQSELCITISNSQIPDQQTIYALPYLRNVHIIAYNSATIQIDNLYAERSTFWSELLKKINDKQIEVKSTLSQYDSGISCFMLDTIITSFNLNKETFPCSIYDTLEKFQKTDINGFNKGFERLLNNLIAIKILFHDIVKDYSENPNEIWEECHLDCNFERVDKNRDLSSQKNDIKNTKHIPDLMVCWYTEFKDLICKNPELQKLYKIISLPGKGFTGDWYIGIQKGSVSKSLGINIIEKICTSAQEHQRFIKGVGLPSKHGYFIDVNNSEGINYHLWSNSEQKLSDIFQIHEDANRRSEMDDYPKIKQALSSLFRHLLSLKDDSEIKTKISDRIMKLLSVSVRV